MLSLFTCTQPYQAAAGLAQRARQEVRALCCAWLVGCQVCFSTHEGKLPPDSPSKSSDEDEEDDSDEGEEDQADQPIPMESVMGPFKV